MLFRKNCYLKNIIHITGLVLVILLFLSINSLAQSQGRVINFQGRLTDQHGNSLDGTYDIIFSIYQSDPNSKPLWTESHTDVNVSSGIVNVLLGSITSLDEPQKVTFDQERYLGITIDCDHDPNTKEDEMLPRQRILPALYSYNADRLDGKESNEFTTPETDAGRPGVAEHLYEGSTRLVDKYIKQSDEEKFQKRVTGSCSSGYSIGVINADGSVLCEKDDFLSKSTVQQWANEVDDTGFNTCTNITVEKNKMEFTWMECNCPSGYKITGYHFAGVDTWEAHFIRDTRLTTTSFRGYTAMGRFRLNCTCCK